MVNLANVFCTVLSVLLTGGVGGPSYRSKNSTIEFERIRIASLHYARKSFLPCRRFPERDLPTLLPLSFCGDPLLVRADPFMGTKLLSLSNRVCSRLFKSQSRSDYCCCFSKICYASLSEHSPASAVQVLLSLSFDHSFERAHTF
jgi:hypothetical protein